MDSFRPKIVNCPFCQYPKSFICFIRFYLFTAKFGPWKMVTQKFNCLARISRKLYQLHESFQDMKIERYERII